jgi:PilZ domain-containing protein
MSPQAEASNAGDSTDRSSERRQNQRYLGTAIVEIIRESDSRRIYLPVDLVDFSIAGIGLLSLEAFAPDDRVKIRLRNVVRRVLKDVRGVVRWALLTGEGMHRVGIELTSRFSTLDMQLLKQLGQKEDQGQKVWF